MNQINMDCLKDAVRYFGEEWSDLPIIALSDSPSSSAGAQGTIIMSEIDSMIPELLNLMENGKLGVCFYPNGAAHNYLIQDIRWHFVDIDAGDKSIQMERIKEAPLAPTMVYRGRKGHKLLYRIKDGKWDNSSPDRLEESIVYFKNIQQQLIEYFEGDKSVINPSRALRMPFVNNYKEFHIGKVYVEELISFNPEYIYTQEEIMNAFPNENRKHHVRKNASNFKEFSQEVNKNLSLFTTYLTNNNLKWTDYGDRLSFSCPIHKDSNPSAYMYKSDLVVYCSRGLADGECEVGSGKTLGWIAQHLGINELLLEWKNLGNRTQEKYFRHINLESMSTTEAIKLEQSSGDNKSLVSNILHNLISVMKERGIEIDYQTKYVYESILNCALDSNKSFLCASLPPGGGKSTLLREMLKYLLQKKYEQSGAIIVVERLETAKQLAKELGNYSCYEEEGGGRDLPNYISKPAAYVMESAFTFKGCKKDLVEYSYGVCRGCEHINNCDLPKKYNTQRDFPVVIISHARLQMEKEKLKNYEFWLDFSGRKLRRNLLIIDEKPSLINIKSLKERDLDQFILEVKSTISDHNEVVYTESLINVLIKSILTSKTGLELPSVVDSNFQFSFKREWYQKYRGVNVDLINQVEQLLKLGGRVHRDQFNQLSAYFQFVSKLDISRFNTIILDGTSEIDLDYRVNQNIDILSMPAGIRDYNKLKIYNAPITISKQSLKKETSLKEKIVESIKILAEEEKVFVLCFKENKPELINNLSKEIAKGRVKINHYGNVKGSNEYVDCTVMVIVGVQHKSDPYYISKHIALNGSLLSSETITINGVRRFKDLDIERIKLNDQLVGIIQDISRTKIRNRSNKEVVRIFIPSRDKIFISLLKQYFRGCSLLEWNLIQSSKPSWYKQIKEIFSGLLINETISKKTLKEKLGLNGPAGNKKLQRMQTTELFQGLLRDYNIRPLSTKMYIRTM